MKKMYFISTFLIVLLLIIFFSPMKYWVFWMEDNTKPVSVADTDSFEIDSENIIKFYGSTINELKGVSADLKKQYSNYMSKYDNNTRLTDNDKIVVTEIFMLDKNYSDYLIHQSDNIDKSNKAINDCFELLRKFQSEGFDIGFVLK